jgi:predicted aspartyl protease
MSNFLTKLDETRPCRYVFKSRLWDARASEFGTPINVLLDTGSFNTIIHESLAVRYGIVLKKAMKVSVGGYRGNANICILHKVNIGGLEIEKVVALAVPFEGELKEHILLGANVTNNWEFTVSRKKNRVTISEEFSDTALNREYPLQVLL